MSLSTKRIAHIMACMYQCTGEAVVNISGNECYLHLGYPHEGSTLFIFYEEMQYLEDSGIIEQDGGSTEEGHETAVYCLTAMAKEKISAFLANNKVLKLNV